MIGKLNDNVLDISKIYQFAKTILTFGPFLLSYMLSICQIFTSQPSETFHLLQTRTGAVFGAPNAAFSKFISKFNRF